MKAKHLLKLNVAFLAAVAAVLFGMQVGVRADANKVCEGVEIGCTGIGQPTADGCNSPAIYSDGWSCEEIIVHSFNVCVSGTGECSHNVSLLCAEVTYYIGGGCQAGACAAGREGTDEYFSPGCSQLLTGRNAKLFVLCAVIPAFSAFSAASHSFANLRISKPRRPRRRRVGAVK